jgi:hypothetical protein
MCVRTTTCERATGPWTHHNVLAVGAPRDTGERAVQTPKGDEQPDRPSARPGHLLAPSRAHARAACAAYRHTQTESARGKTYARTSSSFQKVFRTGRGCSRRDAGNRRGSPWPDACSPEKTQTLGHVCTHTHTAPISRQTETKARRGDRRAGLNVHRGGGRPVRAVRPICHVATGLSLSDLPDVTRNL